MVINVKVVRIYSKNSHKDNYNRQNNKAKSHRIK